MSAGRTTVLTPKRLHSSATFSSSELVRDNKATSAPVSAKAMAVALPMPRPAPAYKRQINAWWRTCDECDFPLERKVLWRDGGIRVVEGLRCHDFGELGVECIAEYSRPVISPSLVVSFLEPRVGRVGSPLVEALGNSDSRGN